MFSMSEKGKEKEIILMESNIWWMEYPFASLKKTYLVADG